MKETTPDPVALLEAHLVKTNQNAQQFAERAKVDASVITRALARDRRPGLDSVIRIDRASNGEVPIPAWEHFRYAPRRRRAS